MMSATSLLIPMLPQGWMLLVVLLLVAAGSLMVGYVLTVAVSIVAGVIAITSAVPELLPYKVPISVFFVAFIMVANLRGVRESGILFCGEQRGQLADVVGFESTAHGEDDVAVCRALDFQHRSSLDVRAIARPALNAESKEVG